MTDLHIDVVDWLAASSGEAKERETLASLKIIVGPDAIPASEVEDTVAKTVRPFINVSAYSLAKWLIVNWWRLRWEPSPSQPTFDWTNSHSLASVGEGFAWPALTFSSDGEFVQLRQESESKPDVSSIRYLQNFTLDVPALDLERAIDAFLDQVEARLAARCPAETELRELRAELSAERQDLQEAASCKLQALGGFDPGAAPDDWLRAVNELGKSAGRAATEEIVAVAPALSDGLASARSVLDAMRVATTEVKLDWISLKHQEMGVPEIPWERGARLARELRKSLGLLGGALTNDALGDLLGTHFPLAKSLWKGDRALLGGYRNGSTRVLVTNERVSSQRFYVARLIGAAVAAPSDESVLPVSTAGTALQKLQRSFAQEFLCPWVDLDAFTDESGIDDDALADAAAHFQVSEQVVRSTLVNKGKLSRSHLPS